MAKNKIGANMQNKPLYSRQTQQSKGRAPYNSKSYAAPSKKQVTFTGSPDVETNESKQSTPAQTIQGNTPRFSDKRKIEQRQSIHQGQQNNNNSSVYRVNMDVIELFLDYSIDNDQHEVNQWRKANRKKQMNRRYKKLEIEHSSMIKSDITAEQISQNLAESRVTESIKQEYVTQNTNSYNESRVITVDGSFREHILTQQSNEGDIINQDVSAINSSVVQDISTPLDQSKDYKNIISQSDTFSKDNNGIQQPPIEIGQLDQSQAPFQQKTSILKQPTGTSDSLKKQFRKQVSISEEPIKINQSDDNMKSFQSISVESKRSSNKNSIISEEDSAFEDTPAANKNNKKVKGNKVNSQKDQYSERGQNFKNHVQVIQDNYSINKKDKQKRSFANTKKSISNYDNNIEGIDKPKGKIHRQHTQDRAQKDESPLPGSSYDGYIAEDSYNQNQNVSGQSRNRHLQVQDGNMSQFNSGQKKSSVISGNNVRININKLKKQTTQDEKKQNRGRQKMAHNRNKYTKPSNLDDSRNESLGFTSDHQLDHLSVNFGRFRRNDNSTEGRDILGVSSVISDFSKMGKGQSSFGQDQKEVFLALSKQKDHLVKNYENRSNTFSQNVISNYDKYRSEEEMDEQRELQNFSGPNIKKAKKKYFKTPYKALCVNQLKTKDRGDFEKLSQSPQPVRLYQAENMLNVNAVYKKKRYNRRSHKNMGLTRVSSTTKRGPIVHQDQRSGSIGHGFDPNYAFDSSPQRLAEEQKILDKQLRLKNMNISSKERLLAEPQSSITVGRQKERGMRNSMTGLVNKNDSRAISNYTNNRSLKNNSYAGVNFSSKYTTSPKNESGKRRGENDFKFRFYDQLIQHLDKRIQNTNGQLHHVRKQKDIFSIYGQELKPITFGNAPYTISAGVMQNQESRQSSPLPDKNKRNALKKQKTQTSGTRGDRLSSLDAENMLPLGEILKQKQRGGQRQSNGGHRKDNSMVNDSIYSMNKHIDPEDSEMYDFNNDKIIAESARVNTGFILQSSDLMQKVVTEQSDENTRENVTPKSNLYLQNGQEDNWNQVMQWGNQGLPFTEIKLLEDMQNSYFKQIETENSGSQDRSSYHTGDQKILAANREPVYGNNSNPDLLTQIVSLTQRMGYSHLQLKLLREKQGQLLESEFELSKEYKLQKIKIKPNKFIFEMSSNMAAIQSQHNKDRNNNAIKSFYPEVEPPRSLIVEQKMGNISQLNKEYYKNKISNYKANKMGFRNTAIIQSCKSSIKPLGQSINMNNTQASINMKITQSNIKAESAKRSVDIESVEDYYGKKINMRRSIEQRITYDAKQFKTNKKQKIQEKQRFGKFKQKGSVSGKLNFEEDIIAAEKMTQEERDEIERGRNSSLSNSPDRNKDFVKRNIKNLGPLGSSYDIGLMKEHQITPQNIAKKQSLIPLNDQRQKQLDSIKSLGRTQKYSNNMAMMSVSVPKNQDLYHSIHKTSKSNAMNGVKNSKMQLIKSGQSILANNGLKHQKEPYVGNSMLSTSNSQLRNQYINHNVSPRLPNQIESEKSLQKRLNVLQSANRQIEADKLRSMGERQPMFNYTQITKNSGKGANLFDYHGISKHHNVKQAQILKGVLTNQRHLQKYIENTSVSPLLDQNSSSGYVRNQSYGYKSNGSVGMRAQINLNSTAVIEPTINTDLRHLGNQSQPQQQVDIGELYVNEPGQ